jgi:hypothetical protein
MIDNRKSSSGAKYQYAESNEYIGFHNNTSIFQCSIVLFFEKVRLAGSIFEQVNFPTLLFTNSLLRGGEKALRPATGRCSLFPFDPFSFAEANCERVGTSRTLLVQFSNCRYQSLNPAQNRVQTLVRAARIELASFAWKADILAIIRRPQGWITELL